MQIIFIKRLKKNPADRLNENANTLSDSRWHFWTSRNTAVTMVTPVNKAALCIYTLFYQALFVDNMKNVNETFLKKVSSLLFIMFPPLNHYIRSHTLLVFLVDISRSCSEWTKKTLSCKVWGKMKFCFPLRIFAFQNNVLFLKVTFKMTTFQLAD